MPRRLLCSTRRRSMYGMISGGGGLGLGMWMPMRLQRALRYGTSRVASRAARSARVAGGVIFVMSFAYIIGPFFLWPIGDAGPRWRIGGAEPGKGLKVEGYQVFKLTCDLFRELEVWVSRLGEV